MRLKLAKSLLLFPLTYGVSSGVIIAKLNFLIDRLLLIFSKRKLIISKGFAFLINASIFYLVVNLIELNLYQN